MAGTFPSLVLYLLQFDKIYATLMPIFNQLILFII